MGLIQRTLLSELYSDPKKFEYLENPSLLEKVKSMKTVLITGASSGIIQLSKILLKKVTT